MLKKNFDFRLWLVQQGLFVCVWFCSSETVWIYFRTSSVAKFIWKLRLRLSGKKISVTVSSWKMSKISVRFLQSEPRSWASAQLAEGALLKLRGGRCRFAWDGTLVVMCANAHRNGLIMFFDTPAILFFIHVILHPYLSSSLFSGEICWDTEGGKPELKKHSPIPLLEVMFILRGPAKWHDGARAPLKGRLKQRECLFLTSLPQPFLILSCFRSNHWNLPFV